MNEAAPALFDPQVYLALRNAHLVLGSVSLLLFWLQIAKRKGGQNHRWIGWCYLVAMLGVLMTAIPMTLFIGHQGQIEAAMLLGFLVLITAAAGVDAIQASRHRQSNAWMRGPLAWGTTVAILVYSILMLILFARTGFPLLIVLALLGFLGTVEHVTKVRGQKPYSWVHEHVDGVIATGIAVHVAFLSFGLRRILGGGGLWLISAFVFPFAVGHLMTVYFRRKLTPRSVAPVEPRTDTSMTEGRVPHL